jgi:hypothetical protein
VGRAEQSAAERAIALASLADEFADVVSADDAIAALERYRALRKGLPRSLVERG